MFHALIGISGKPSFTDCHNFAAGMISSSHCIQSVYSVTHYHLHCSLGHKSYKLCSCSDARRCAASAVSIQSHNPHVCSPCWVAYLVAQQFVLHEALKLSFGMGALPVGCHREIVSNSTRRQLIIMISCGSNIVTSGIVDVVTMARSTGFILYS